MLYNHPTSWLVLFLDYIIWFRIKFSCVQSHYTFWDFRTILHHPGQGLTVLRPVASQFPTHMWGHPFPTLYCSCHAKQEHMSDFLYKCIWPVRLLDLKSKMVTTLWQCLRVPARNNSYDGVQEFWITIRETAERTTETSYEEVHKKAAKAPNNIDAVNLRVSVSIMYIAHIQWPHVRHQQIQHSTWGVRSLLPWMPWRRGIKRRRTWNWRTRSMTAMARTAWGIGSFLVTCFIIGSIPLQFFLWEFFSKHISNNIPLPKTK